MSPSPALPAISTSPARARMASVRGATLVAALATLAGTACRPSPPSIEWQEGDGYRWAELRVLRRGHAGFRQLEPGETGVTFANAVTEEQALENEHLYNGSGVAAGDVDGDGLVDLYFTRLDGPNVLYRNRGHWRFEDVTERAGVAAADRFSTGTTLVDVDGDGDLDLLVTSLGGPHSLFINDGTGVFEDRTAESGLASGYYGTTMALADVDGDGDLDLYVANNKVRPVRDMFPPSVLEFDSVVRRVGDRYEVRPEFRDHYTVSRQGNRLTRFEFAEPDKFYLNDGAGRFTQVSLTSGRFLDEAGRPLRSPLTDWGLTARFFDADGDGDPDLYVCNDFESPDRFWLNDGTGRFRLIPHEAIRTTSNANMAIDVSDLDRDGDVDLFTLDMLDRNSGLQKTQRPARMPEEPAIGDVEGRQQVPRNALLLNRGDGTYAEVAYLAGVEASGWSWSVAFLDVDLDGWEDLLIANGHARDFLDSDTRARLATFRPDDWRRTRFLFPTLELTNVAFRNLGDLRFEEIGEHWGFGVEPDVAHGMALADLDGDGDLDVVTNRLGKPAGVYRNETAAPRVAVRLRGLGRNAAGVGARITLRGGPVSEQTREIASGGAYLSGSQMMAVFAAGQADSLVLVVDWRSGRRSVVPGVRPNRLYEVFEASATLPTDSPEASPPEPLFRDVSSQLGYTHTDDSFDDFARQPLLPHRLSQLGPGVAWVDVDRDGDEDLVLGTGRGGRVTLYRNDRGRLVLAGREQRAAPLDRTAILAIPSGRRMDLAVGQSSYEATAGAPAPAVLRISSAGLRSSALVESAEAAAGPLALADADQDGDLDLFVGGRVIPGQYPRAAPSALYRNDGGQFVADTAAPFRDVGLVSGAVFSDLDGDGDADLVLAIEWGPVRVFHNDGGRFTDVTVRLGLEGHRGFWNGVATGDFDEDGRPDIVATNWGRNTRLRVSPDRPLQVYYADFDRSGSLDLLLAQFDPRLGDVAPLRGRAAVSLAIPYVRGRFETYRAYADATLRDVIGPPLSDAQRLEVTTLDHRVFLNRGARFESTPLPLEAQFAPAFAAVVLDADGDGHDDVYLAQNFSPTDEETQRWDAGRGLLLSGDGRGGFIPLQAPRSGLAVYGDARGAATSDFDGDGRADLAVAQNSGPTRLYRNQGGKPGLRVRLIGPDQNPDAVGATLRVVYAEGRGPLREVQAGSGYWSSNGAVQVLGLRGDPVRVLVRWPDGTRVEEPVVPGSREVIIGAPR